MLPVSPIKSEKTSRKSASNDSQIGRIKISFVDAQTARNYAIATAKEASEVPFSNGVLAFDGEYVSGNTTLASFSFSLVLIT